MNDEMSPEEEARLMRRYHLGAVVRRPPTWSPLLRAIFSSLVGSPRANIVALANRVSWLADKRHWR